MTVACYHNLPVEDSVHTFPDRGTMRQHLYPAIDAAWVDLTKLESTGDGIRPQCELYPDSVFNLRGSWSPELKRHLPQGKLVRETVLFKHFTAGFSRLPEVNQNGTDRCGPTATVPFIGPEAITKLEPLGGRGTSTKVTVQLNGLSIPGVMKGLSFFEYLAHSDDSGNTNGRFEAELRAMNNEINLIMSILRQPHPSPYIMRGPIAFCTFDDVTTLDTKLPRIYAAIYPFYEAGTLLDAVGQHNATLTRIPLPNLARWCYQLTEALHHTHITCHTYHMDLKIDNILLDPSTNSIIIIDWEQSGANPFSLAPEAAQELDVVLNSETGLLEFRPFQDSDGVSETKRQNNPLGTPEWNVFPGWAKECPLAAEMAEVYSLGCTMWQLLKHHDFEDQEMEWRLEENHERWVGVEGVIPENWRETVDNCIQADPNKRMRLSELMGFWEKEAREMGALADDI